MYERTLHQTLSVPGTASQPAREILTTLLNKNPAERLGSKRDFDEIRDHGFFTPIDWAKLLRREVKPPFVPKVRGNTCWSERLPLLLGEERRGHEQYLA